MTTVRFECDSDWYTISLPLSPPNQQTNNRISSMNHISIWFTISSGYTQEYNSTTSDNNGYIPINDQYHISHRVAIDIGETSFSCDDSRWSSELGRGGDIASRCDFVVYWWLDIPVQKIRKENNKYDFNFGLNEILNLSSLCCSSLIFRRMTHKKQLYPQFRTKWMSTTKI